MTEHLGATPYVCFRPDFVPPSSFLVIKDKVAKTSHIPVQAHLINAEFRKSWMSYFGLGIQWLRLTSSWSLSTLSFLRSLFSWRWRWPQGFLDVFFFPMIPKVDGDPTPLGQRSSCVLPSVFRFGASLRVPHVKDWFRAGSHSLFSVLEMRGVGGGGSSVETWFSTALDIEGCWW